MKQNITGNGFAKVLAVIAVVVGVGFAIPSAALAYSTYDLGGSYGSGSGYSSAGTIYGTTSCCGSYGGYKPTYSYPKTPTYNYGSGSNYGSSYGGGLNLNFSWQDNDNETTYNNNVNINQNGNDNYIGGVAISNENNTNQENSTNTNQNQNYPDFGDYAYKNKYVGGPGIYSGSNSNNNDDDDDQNNNSNINITNGSNDDDDDDDDNDNNNDDEPSCDLEASDKSVDEGDRVTLSWETDDAEEASINQGIGSVDEDGGEERVTVDEDTTFRMTVEDNDGDEATCSVTVNVDEDDDDNDNAFSSTVFTDEPPQNPPQVVYLSSIPYTGLGDISPAIMAYWVLLIAGAGGVAYFMFSKGMFRSLVPAYAGNASYSELADETEEESATDVNAFVTALEANDNENVIEQLRTAAANGTGIEEFLSEIRAAVSDTDGIASRIDAMIEGSRMTGIRGAKLALGA